MTQDERWQIRYQEVIDFIEKNHRNPSKHYDEERNMHTFVKHCKKQLNAGQLKEDRIERFNKLLELAEKYKHVNQYQ
jgi:hypothetical protein